MCRHLAYVGPALPLAVPMLDAPHALVRQVRTPRHQLPGVVNEDGWGMAWWEGTAIRRHRSTIPLPDDHDGHALVRAVHAGAFVAAVRRATPGSALVETGNAPFVADGLVFSLNGFVGGFHSGAAGGVLRGALGRHHDVDGDTDSEVLFALVRDRVDAGADAPTALAAVVERALDAADGPSNLNLLLSDGQTVWATRRGNSLFSLRHPDGSRAVASEPWDDDPAWVEVPDGSVLAATAATVEVADLA
jgi:predicted glutamine amidotransferase